MASVSHSGRTLPISVARLTRNTMRVSALAWDSLFPVCWTTPRCPAVATTTPADRPRRRISSTSGLALCAMGELVPTRAFISSTITNTTGAASVGTWLPMWVRDRFLITVTGLGSHDLSVATHAAQLWKQGVFPRIVFTGANAPTTKARFPRGEAVHYREHALELG
jgi:hypothetical protein